MEVWDLVDENKRPINKLHTRGEAQQPGEYHVVVEILTVNADGRILLTQRDAEKTYPLLWETTGGSVTAGESSLQGAVRELAEETGLVAEEKELKFLGEFAILIIFWIATFGKERLRFSRKTSPCSRGKFAMRNSSLCQNLKIWSSKD